MSIKIERFHKYEKGHLYGFMDISIPVWNTTMHIKGCKVFLKEGKQWFAMPSKEYTNEAGETKYSPLVSIEDENVYKQLMNGIHEAWKEYCQDNQAPPEPPPPQYQEPVQEGLPF